MNIPINTLNYLKKVYGTIREVLMNQHGFKDVCSVIIFGSAARPEDFVIGVSDVDVLVLTVDEPETRRYGFTVYDLRVDVTVFSMDEFNRLVEHGHPLVFMLKYSSVIYDAGCFKHVLELKPTVTEYTKQVLRRSIFAALGLALESYYVLKNYRKAVSHLYHSIRHMIRYKALSRGVFPISDREVYEYCKSSLRDMYMALSNARRRERFREDELKELINKAIILIGKELNIKTVSIKDLEKIAGRDIYLIMAMESNNHLIFRVGFYDDERKVIEIKDGEIREINNIFS